MNTTPANLLEHLRQPAALDAWERFVEFYTPLIYYWSCRRTGPESYQILPLELIEWHQLHVRYLDRGREREVLFLIRDRPVLLPVWLDGRLQLVRWGNRRNDSRTLPATGWTWLKTV